MQWIYREGLEVKHLLKNKYENKTLCGAGFSWYTSNEWKHDNKGLETKRACKNCVSISASGNIAGHLQNQAVQRPPE